MAKRKGLIKFPGNVFEWQKAFGDDLGYEATILPEPVDSLPGSPEKIAAIIERLSRGHVLWSEGDVGDGVSEPVYDALEYRVVGSESYGAVVGVDQEGHRHRYAVWKYLGGKGDRLNYITHTAGYRDCFESDRELSLVLKHATTHGASFIAVASLFSARVNSPKELRDCAYPITALGMLWLRWIARYCDKTVACWGDASQMERNVDVLWMLSRTSVGRHVYAVGLTEAGNPCPIGSQRNMERFEYREIIADREEEEADDTTEVNRN